MLWIIFPGNIENDPEARFSRGLFLVPILNSHFSGLDRLFFKTLFSKDLFDLSIQCVAQSNGSFLTNDDAPIMGRHALLLSTISPKFGTDTPNRLRHDDIIIGSTPTTGPLGRSGQIKYKKSFADKLTEIFLKIMEVYR